MDCAEARGRMAALIDGELAPAEADAFAAHLASCVECAARRDTAIASTSALRVLPYYPAPAAMRAAIQDSLPRRSRVSRVRMLSALVAAAALVLAVSAGAWWQRRAASPDAVDQIVATHVRSLMLPGHLTDVASSDQHTVKPWFTGRIDFSPPVTDFADKGFPLLGGRLDYLDGHPVAALVYGRRLHRINVFVGPSERPRASIDETSRRGFTVLRWTASSFDYVAVSDVSAPDLRELAKLIGS